MDNSHMNRPFLGQVQVVQNGKSSHITPALAHYNAPFTICKKNSSNLRLFTVLPFGQGSQHLPGRQGGGLSLLQGERRADPSSESGVMPLSSLGMTQQVGAASLAQECKAFGEAAGLVDRPEGCRRLVAACLKRNQPGLLRPRRAQRAGHTAFGPAYSLLGGHCPRREAVKYSL